MDGMTIFLCLFCALVIAWCIGDAVKNYKKKNFFLFGLNAAIAIYETLGMV